MVEYVDVLPTFLDVDGGKMRKDLDGRSFLDVLLGKKDEHKEFVFGEMTTRGINNGSETFGIRSVRGERYKYIWNFTPEVEFKNACTHSKEFRSWIVKAESGDYAKLNGIFKINGSHPTDVSYGSNFADKGYVYIDINENFNVGETIEWSNFAGKGLDISSNEWKEIGVIGSESIRTFTDTIGDYKLGINTVARSGETDYTTSFVTGETTPRANLDVVGTAFISGKSIDFLTRDETDEDNAFLVGWVSFSPNSGATLRVATSNGGRVGINTVADNTNDDNLDRNLVVIGNSRFTDDAKFQQDIDVNGGEVRTAITSGTFSLLSNIGFVGTLTAGDLATTINIGSSATSSSINFGTVSDGNSSNISIGGGYNLTTTVGSVTDIKTRFFKAAGDFEFGYRRTGVGSSSSITSPSKIANIVSNSSGPSIVNFAPFFIY